MGRCSNLPDLSAPILYRLRQVFSESQKGVEPRTNHERTPRNCRRTVENGNRWGTGGSGGETVIELDFSFDLPDFDGLLDDLDLDISLDGIDLDFNLPDDLPLNRERTARKLPVEDC